MGDQDIEEILLSSDDETKPSVQDATEHSKKQKNIHVSTRNMTVSTRTIPNAKNNLKNIQSANSFKTANNSTARSLITFHNGIKITELPLNKHKNLKIPSNVMHNSQSPKISVVSKQSVSSQDQHFKRIHSTNSVSTQHLHNRKTFFDSQNSDKYKNISRSSFVPISTKSLIPSSVSNAKMILMKNVTSGSEKLQADKNRTVNVSSSLLSSLQKNGISVSSLQKCGISVTNVANDSKDSPKNKQNSVILQSNLNHARFSAKENGTKSNAISQTNKISQVRNDFIKSNSLCQATVRTNKRKVPPTDVVIPNKKLCFQKTILPSKNIVFISDTNSALKITQLSGTLEKSQNKSYGRTIEFPTGNLHSENQHVKETKTLSLKSVPLTKLQTPLISNSKTQNIISRENINAGRSKYNALKIISLPSNSLKQPDSLLAVTKNTVNNLPKTKIQDTITNPKNVIMNSVTSSSCTPFLNSSLSVSVVNPVKKPELNNQSVISPSVIEKKSAQSKISSYLIHKKQPLRTNHKSIDVTNDRKALLNLLALCESEGDTEAKNTKVKNANLIDPKATKDKNVTPIVISLDNECESSITPVKNIKNFNVSSILSIKLKEIQDKIRYWPKPVVVLERIDELDKHIAMNNMFEQLAEKIELSTSKIEPLVKPKIAKLNERDREEKTLSSPYFNETSENTISHCKNDDIPSNIVNVNLKSLKNTETFLSGDTIILSEINDDDCQKPVENSKSLLSNNKITAPEIVNDSVSLNSNKNIVALSSGNNVTVSVTAQEDACLELGESTVALLRENAPVKAIQMHENKFENTCATNKIVQDLTESNSREVVKNLLTFMSSIVETYNEIINVSNDENKNSEKHDSSDNDDSIRTKFESRSNLSLPESDEIRKDEIKCIEENVRNNILVSKDTSFVSLKSVAELYNDNTNCPSEYSSVFNCISDIIEKVESILTVDKNITKVQYQLPSKLVNISESTSMHYDKSLLNNELFIDGKTNCLSDKFTKTSNFDEDNIDMVNESNHESDADDLNVTLNEVLTNQVTSPKLSLKRNRAELTPDRKSDEGSTNERSSGSVAKKIKFGEQGVVLDKKIETTHNADFTSQKLTDMPLSSNGALPVPVIELSDEEKLPVELSDEEKLPVLAEDNESSQEFQIVSFHYNNNVNKNEEKDIFEKRKKKLLELLDFSAKLMKDTTEEEKLMIKNRLMNSVNSAEKCYVESENFNLLLDISFEKVKRTETDVLVILLDIRNELKNHKKKSKKVKASSEDVKLSITDDSISKDIFIDSSSSLPSKVNKVDSAPLDTSFDFVSRFKDYFKVAKKPELLQTDSASCSSLTSESSKVLTCNKNTIDDSGKNFQTITKSNKELLVSDNFEFNSSVITSTIEPHSVESSICKISNSDPSKVASTSKMHFSTTAVPNTKSVVCQEKDLSLQSSKSNKMNDSGNNLETSTKLDKMVISGNFVANEFSSSAISSAVQLQPVGAKNLKFSSSKNPPEEKLVKDSFDSSTSAVHESTATIFGQSVIGNDDLSKKSYLSSIPSTSGWLNPSSKLSSKSNNSTEKSCSNSVDSLSRDKRTLLEKNEDERNAKRIKKLERHLKELDKAIKKCQKKELSLDDLENEDSAYLKESQYKNKFIKVYNMLCKLKKVPARTGRIIEKKFHYEGSRYRLINEEVENCINRRKAHEKFPDYHEVYSIIRKVHETHDLGFSESDISKEAKRVFEDIGEALKERRWRDETELLGCYLTDDLNLDQDPAEHDENLKKTLEENSKKFNESINQVIDHYVEKQQQASAEENAADDDDEEDEVDADDEKEEVEEEIVADAHDDSDDLEVAHTSVAADAHDDSDDLPGTAPASPVQNDITLVKISDQDDDDIEIINYSDKSTDPEDEVKRKQIPTVNKTNISESVVLEDSESSGDLPTVQELMKR